MSNDLELRAYRAENRASVIQLWTEIFPDDPPWNQPELVIDQKLTVQPELFIVAVIDGVLVGTILAGYDGVRGWVHKLAVHPDYRRRGLASKLMNRAEAGLKALGCTKLNFQVRASNTEVLQFYETLGYGVEERVSLGKRLI